MKSSIVAVLIISFVLVSYQAGAAECDINGDGKTGLVEAIYALQVVAGINPTICRSNLDCPKSEFCQKVEGDCEGIGTCSKRPEGCFDLWDPVCGCDKKTHSNSCYAAMAGVNVLKPGECRDTSCDDGSIVLCMMPEPVLCDEYEILAIQGNCWVCVNPATCKPWGVPNCRESSDCPEGFVCDACGTSSCPFCDDCVAACVPEET